MKKLLTLGFISVLACSGVTLSIMAQTTAPSTTAPATPVHRERHPAIRGAIHALERAKIELQAANHDFGGHRADALAECDKAIGQLQLALQYDQH